MNNNLEIEKLILLGKSENLELKSSFKSELIETLIAFANTSGGKVIIGIIINMIVHCDYRSSSDSIVKVYDTKIEFYNPGRLPDSITLEDLLTNNYRSTPRNKLIADFCKTSGLIEKYGSGIRRIVNYFVESKLPKPEFKNISEGFMVTVYLNSETNIIINEPENVTENDAVNVAENVTENRRIRILNLIKDNNTISTTNIANLLGVARRTIARDIETSKSKELLKRNGPDKGGYWEIIN